MELPRELKLEWMMAVLMVHWLAWLRVRLYLVWKRACLKADRCWVLKKKVANWSAEMRKVCLMAVLMVHWLAWLRVG